MKKPKTICFYGRNLCLCHNQISDKMAVNLAYKCAYCDEANNNVATILLHGNEKHSGEVAKFKELQLNEQCGKYMSSLRECN